MSGRPEFRLYNSLTRRVEPLRPLEEEHLRVYSCGPTVYSHAHIGNFRSFVTVDLILRVARSLGWRTTYVTNITDVGHLTDDDLADASGEDKMEKALRTEEGGKFANIWDLAAFYEDSVLRDWHALNLLEPDVRPRATQHVREQIQAIERLISLGHAYETSQGVYFSVDSFPDYGKLSGNEAAEALELLVRNTVADPEKRDPRDFALWKKDPKHLMQWYSPWGWGYPGWHIECSVMANTYLGETVDLHAGGEDLRFPHHDCEIAQSESLTKKPFARHWVHTRFLRAEGEKMSKSRGNFLLIADLTRPRNEGGHGHHPLAVRYALLSGHYRKPFNFTFKNLDDSAKQIDRYAELYRSALQLADQDDNGNLSPRADLMDALEKTRGALLDDLNTPVALASALDGVKLLEREKRTGDWARQALFYLDGIEDLLGLVRKTQSEPAGAEADGAAEEAIERLVADRTEARARRDWAAADAIREELAKLGVQVTDTADGPVWSRVEKPSG